MVTRSQGRFALFVLMSFCLGFGGAELLMRAYAAFGGPVGGRLAKLDPLGVLVEPVGDHGFRQKPNTNFPYANGTAAHSNAMNYRGPEVQIPKPYGTYRIVLLGGSATHGFGVDDDQTIDVYMRTRLSELYPDRTIEVVNLAMDAYDAYAVLERLRTDGRRFEPDLVIVNSGINDVRNASLSALRYPDPRTWIYESHMARMREERARGGPRAWTMAKHYSYVLRMPGLARELMRERRRRDSAGTVRPNPEVSNYFGQSLRAVARETRAMGADLVLSSPPSALAMRFDPEDTSEIAYWVVNAATTEKIRRDLSARMANIADELSRSGATVPHLTHHLGAELFYDDCHLLPEGNRQVALHFVEAAAEFIEPWSKDLQ